MLVTKNRYPLRERVAVRAATLVRDLAQHQDRAGGQGEKCRREQESADATTRVEQRRGQQRPEQPRAVQIRLEQGDGVE